jgi:hypothetical protein
MLLSDPFIVSVCSAEQNQCLEKELFDTGRLRRHTAFNLCLKEELFDTGGQPSRRHSGVLSLLFAVVASVVSMMVIRGFEFGTVEDYAEYFFGRDVF